MGGMGRAHREQAAATEAALLAAGRRIEAERGRGPTRAELILATGASLWTVERHRLRLEAEGRWPQGWAVRRAPRPDSPPEPERARIAAEIERMRAARMARRRA